MEFFCIDILWIFVIFNVYLLLLIFDNVLNVIIYEVKIFFLYCFMFEVKGLIILFLFKDIKEK